MEAHRRKASMSPKDPWRRYGPPARQCKHIELTQNTVLSWSSRDLTRAQSSGLTPPVALSLAVSYSADWTFDKDRPNASTPSVQIAPTPNLEDRATVHSTRQGHMWTGSLPLSCAIVPLLVTRPTVPNHLQDPAVVECNPCFSPKRPTVDAPWLPPRQSHSYGQCWALSMTCLLAPDGKQLECPLRFCQHSSEQAVKQRRHNPVHIHHS